MKRFVACILALLMLLSLAACGGKTGDNTENSTEEITVDISALKTKIVEELKVEGAMDLPVSRLSALYGIEEADVKNSACFITMGGTFPDEIIMVEAVDGAAASRVEEKLQARLDEVKKQSQNYDAENYALAQACKVMKAGNTVALFISAQHEEMENMFSGK